MKLLIGGGEGKIEVEGLARELGVSDLIDFMPPTDFTDIPRYIAASDLVVLPFIYAPTTSRSLLEAMAMGKPIITVPVGENKEILRDGEDVIFVERTSDKIALAIERLLENKGLMQCLGANARELVKDKFSLQKIIEQEVDLFERLVNLLAAQRGVYINK